MEEETQDKSPEALLSVACQPTWKHSPLTQHRGPRSLWGQIDFLFWINQLSFLCLRRGGGLFTSEAPTLDYRSIFLFHFLVSTDAFASCALLGRFAGACFFILSELGLTDFFSPWTYHALCREQRFRFLFKGKKCILGRTDEDRSDCLYHVQVEKIHHGA